MQLILIILVFLSMLLTLRCSINRMPSSSSPYRKTSPLFNSLITIVILLLRAKTTIF